MLHEIRIRDLGVIEAADVELGPGLTVLTGETGAGKTMVVTSLGLLLGARADAGLVRAGAGRARVEGLVGLPEGHPALERAAEAGGSTDDELVLVRTVAAGGRSRAHVGGTAAPASVLTEIGELLVAVHGQADQWRLRHPDEHREVLDRFAGDDLAAALERHADTYAAHARARSELATLREQEASRAQEIDLLTLGLERIERLDPAPGEDQDLRAEDERLGHLEELRAAATQAHELLVGDDDTLAVPGVADRLATAKVTLASAGHNDPLLAEMATRAAELGHLARDLGEDLTRYLGSLDVDPSRLAFVQERRAALATLTRLYGEDVDAVLAWGQRAAARLAELEGADTQVAELEAELERLEAQRRATADELTSLRRAAATRLADAITAELAHLSMGSALVYVDVARAERISVHGQDVVELQLAANPGAPARSVVKAASGGELSRVMLAIEVATAAQGTLVPTFVFDEVDAGVGGKAALDVGARLARLARDAQVIVVTHLAQVAAYADRHLVVRKSADGQVTRSDVEAVEGEDRVAELARMLSGTQSDAALEHARDLLDAVAAAR